MEVNHIENQRPTPVGHRYQYLAAGFCFLLGIAMILNTQMSGEGMWFWYGQAFRHGLRLYADLHLPLQPLFILETDWWNRVFGIKCYAVEMRAVLHVIAYAYSIFLVLRESRWADWQKGIVLASAFALAVSATSYRLDDYHVGTETVMMLALAVMLQLARTEAGRRQNLLIALLGLLCGLTITFRINDGGALFATTLVCVAVILRSRRLPLLGLLSVTTVVTALLVVRLTGDNFHDYLYSTVFRAAASKGGAGTFLAAPVLALKNSLRELASQKRLLLLLATLLAAGAGASRWLRWSENRIIALQLGLAAMALILWHIVFHREFLGTWMTDVLLVSVPVLYAAPAVAAVRAFSARRSEFDVRSVLILIPTALWISLCTSSGGEPLPGYCEPQVMLLLLVLVLDPFRLRARWANASVLAMTILVGLAAVNLKVRDPYAWNDFQSYPMFEHRVWYEHPIYGPLYIDRDSLAFDESICHEIANTGDSQGLLSIPYPEPNYFCGIPPWRGYIQTYFDTTLRSTIQQLETQLETAPPSWIVYQRQMRIMEGAEQAYNHGQPLAQRDLDALIMQRVKNGQWTVVDRQYYPPILLSSARAPDDGYYLIHTTPKASSDNAASADATWKSGREGAISVVR